MQKLNIDTKHDYVAEEQMFSKGFMSFESAEISAESCDEDFDFEGYGDRATAYKMKLDCPEGENHHERMEEEEENIITSQRYSSFSQIEDNNDIGHERQIPDMPTMESITGNKNAGDLLKEDISDVVEWNSSYHSEGLYSSWAYFSDEAIALILKAQSAYGGDDDEKEVRCTVVKNLLTITLKFGNLMRGVVATLTTCTTAVENIYITAETLLKRREKLGTVAGEAFRRYLQYKSLIPTHFMFRHSTNNGRRIKFHTPRNPFEGCYDKDTFMVTAADQINQDIAFMWKNLDAEINTMLMSMLTLSEKISGMDPMQVYQGYVEHGPLSTCGNFKLKRERFRTLNGNTNSTIILGSSGDKHKALDMDDTEARGEMCNRYRGFDMMGAEPFLLRSGNKRSGGRGAGEASEAMKAKHALESFFPMDYNKGKAVVLAGKALIAVIEPRQTSSMTWETLFGDNGCRTFEDRYIYGTVLRRHMPTINSAGEAVFHGMFRMNKGEHVGIRKDKFSPGQGPVDSGLIFKTSKAVYYHSPAIATDMHEKYGSYTDKKRLRCGYSNWFKKFSSSSYDSKNPTTIDVKKGITSNQCPDLRSTLFEMSYVISILTPLVSNSANTIHSTQGESIKDHCFFSGKDTADNNTLFLVAYTRSTVAGRTHVSDQDAIVAQALLSKETRKKRRQMGETHTRKVTMLRRQHVRWYQHTSHNFMCCLHIKKYKK